MKLLRSCYINVVKTKNQKKKNKIRNFFTTIFSKKAAWTTPPSQWRAPSSPMRCVPPVHPWVPYSLGMYRTTHVHIRATRASHTVYPVCVCVLCLCVCERICNKKLLLNARCQLTTDTQLCLLLRLHMPRRYRKKIMLQCVHHAHHIYYLQDIVFRY